MAETVCIFDDCEDTNIRAKGLCAKHYERWVRAEKPIKDGRPDLSKVPTDRVGRGGLVRVAVYVEPATAKALAAQATARGTSVSALASDWLHEKVRNMEHARSTTVRKRDTGK